MFTSRSAISTSSVTEIVVETPTGSLSGIATPGVSDTVAVNSVNSPIHTISGAILSSTVMLAVHVVELPDSSITSTVTATTPTSSQPRSREA